MSAMKRSAPANPSGDQEMQIEETTPKIRFVVTALHLQLIQPSHLPLGTKLLQWDPLLEAIPILGELILEVSSQHTVDCIKQQIVDSLHNSEGRTEAAP